MFDIGRLLEIGMKGMTIVKTLAQQGKDVAPVITALTNVFSKRAEDITEKDLDETEALLDAKLDEFEKPMAKLEKK